MKNPKGAWRMCFGATLVLFCVVGLTINAFSVYLPYLLEKCRLTNTQNSNVLLVRSVFAFIALLFVGNYYEKLEIRLGMTVAALCGAVSLALYAAAETFPALCAAAAIGGLAYGWGGMYPASLLIKRWFPVHTGTALGICTASTGIATIVGAPVVTELIESISLEFAFYAEAALLLVSGILCVILVRSWPDGAKKQKHIEKKRKKFRLTWMFLAVVAIGVLGNTGFQFIPMLYSTQGIDAYGVSALVSVVGAALTVSKFLFGAATDRFGAFRSNWVFFGLTAAGCLLCTLGNGYGMALAAMVLLGLGLSFSTVGLTVYAQDLYSPGEFEDTVREFQIAYLLGALLFGSAPGLLADWTGDYRAFYALVTALAIFAMTVVQSKYWKQK